MSDPGDAGERRSDEADGTAGPDADEDSEWEFSLQDLEQREADAEAAAAAERERRRPLEPGDPSLENVLFVILGVLLALFIISRMFLL
ncbi:hypothetical protein HWV07_06000 [Natronomonas salina]|uniref:DUF7312 domain-containing protein n=1 Tax=Natronomonas salina TaxID=1710540 RepID=UPI0015B6BAC3|nr:hypothetical protein [Natronomonas salina]QLD88608.1 hypothetical protein HWV07_06000 [Natronomonas salina]